MSGSRGEANFVWKCKNCKVGRFSCTYSFTGLLTHDRVRQRESSASIKAAPVAYQQSEPAKPHKMIEFDCRGLEFTEFKPEVKLKQLFCQDYLFAHNRRPVRCDDAVLPG